jgi:two-component system response regulator YesN
MLKEVTDYLLVYPSKRYNPALEIYYSIALMFLNHINKWNLTERIAFKIGLNKLTRLDEHQSWKDAIEYFLKLAQVIFDLQRNEQDKTTINTVMIIQRYIEEHLSEDLSLIKLAEQVHFNASYLSRLFKQVVGTNIKDYIYDLRIEEAKVLLITSNLKIHEIAKMVGYESSHYFARFFRKTTNMTPQEFRGSSNENANR